MKENAGVILITIIAIFIIILGYAYMKTPAKRVKMDSIQVISPLPVDTTLQNHSEIPDSLFADTVHSD